MSHEIAKFLSRIAGTTEFTVEPSSNPAFGHYATNVAFRLSAREKRPPLEVAGAIKEKIVALDREGLFARIEVVPPGFINFWLSKKTIQAAFEKIIKRGARWGSGKISNFQFPISKKRPVVVIDYSHPNIAKPMSVAHLRSTIIGAALVNIFKFSGWKVIGDNHLGDWGKQFGVLIAAYKENFKSQITIDGLLKLYVDYTARMKEDPALEEVARRETKKLQNGDRENTKIWKTFYAVSLAEFKKIYKILNVEFDYYLGESSYKTMLLGIVEDALAKGVAVRSEGAVVIPIGGRAPFVIQKSDEAFLYSTTDIAAVKYRAERFAPDIVLYVVDNGQSLHFEQLFEAVRKLGYASDSKLVHVKFGLILSEDLKKLSTRSGRHISLESVIREAVRRAGEVVGAKRPDLTPRERDRVAKAVGIAALKYNDLSQNRQSDIAFRWEKMLSFEGQSAPYLMYTYTRLRSILRKAKVGEFRGESLENELDLAVILKLIQFPEVVEKVRETYFPHYLAEYLALLAKLLNHYYEREPILGSPPALRSARLALTKAAASTLKNGLNCLGIETLERM